MGSEPVGCSPADGDRERLLLQNRGFADMTPTNLSSLLFSMPLM